ncbi:MAG: uncharacterized SAM-binding protein YcdF (DUF218 family) [Paracoccaceae bacterium]|jgi:uncharacterized SAM-binding protein YcdF (DUF218 family)
MICEKTNKRFDLRHVPFSLGSNWPTFVHMKTGLILGAAVWATGPSPTLRRRTMRAAQLFHDGAVADLICCGGLGKHPPTEAAMMRGILIDAGVPSHAITIEDLSTTTAENIAFALPLLETRHVVIVTDWYHGPRARLVARRLGLSARSVAPSLRGAKPLAQIKATLREIPAYIAYVLRLRGS